MVSMNFSMMSLSKLRDGILKGLVLVLGLFVGLFEGLWLLIVRKLIFVYLILECSWNWLEIMRFFMLFDILGNVVKWKLVNLDRFLFVFFIKIFFVCDFEILFLNCVKNLVFMRVIVLFLLLRRL